MFLRKIILNLMAVAVLTFLTLWPRTSVLAEDITTVAQTALREVQSIQSETESRQVEEYIKTKVTSFTRGQRMEFIEEVARSAASVNSGDKERALFSALSLIKMSETTTLEKARALSRLFESSDPNLNKIAEGFLKGYCLDTGTSEDLLSRLSVFRPVFEERSDEANQKLIHFLFKWVPIEAATWLAENIEMTDDERAMLTKEINLADQILKSTGAPLRAPIRPIVTNAVREQKLYEWVTGHSWILQFVAKSLLEKSPPWMTPDLQAAIEIIRVPATIELRVTNSDKTTGEINPIKNPNLPVTPLSGSDENVMKERKSYTLWHWILAVSVVIVMGATVFIIKKYY